jgi:hypothetical protein
MPKAKATNHKQNGSALGFEVQLWAAAEQAVPAPHCARTEYNSARPEGLFLKYISDAFEEKREQLLFGFSDPKSEWFIKDKPQRAELPDGDVCATGLCRPPRLLQIREARRYLFARLRPHAGPFRRRGGSGRRRRTVRAKDETAHDDAGGTIRGIGEAGKVYPPKP